MGKEAWKRKDVKQVVDQPDPLMEAVFNRIGLRYITYFKMLDVRCIPEIKM